MSLMDQGPPICGCVTTGHARVLIEDASIDETDTQESAGADICGVEVLCSNGLTGHGVEAVVTLGGGFICEGPSDACLTATDDPRAAIGPLEQECRHGVVPSPYVSLGFGAG